MSTAKLFTPLAAGSIQLANRIVMAPLTRCRSLNAELAPTALNAEYYAQRASGGLIISEGTQVHPLGQGYVGTPGIYSAAQQAGWKLVTDAVHAKQGKIVAQLWHVGRVSHPDFFEDKTQKPLAPSAISFGGAVHTQEGKRDAPVPEALTAAGIADVVQQFKKAAQVAKDAGFDGVELHGANGYLIDQFLRTGSNTRTDEFGGSLENRLRFPLAVVDALLEVWDAGAVGVRISPVGIFNNMQDDNPVETFGAFAKACADRKLGFIELVGQLFDQPEAPAELPAVQKAVREAFPGTIIANGNLTVEAGIAQLESGLADAVSFGREFLANPDLPERIQNGVTDRNELRPALFYNPAAGAEGYTDYPAIKA